MCFRVFETGCWIGKVQLGFWGGCGGKHGNKQFTGWHTPEMCLDASWRRGIASAELYFMVQHFCQVPKGLLLIRTPAQHL